MKTFNIGDAVLFVNGWGLCYDNTKTFRWGELRAGFITCIEHVEARDSYLYTVSTIDEYDPLKVRTKLLGPHLIFKLSEKELAKTTLQQYCQEVIL